LGVDCAVTDAASAAPFASSLPCIDGRSRIIPLLISLPPVRRFSAASATAFQAASGQARVRAHAKAKKQPLI